MGPVAISKGQVSDKDKELFQDKEWFNANFFDVRRHRPKKGQCLAMFRANAFFVDDWVKRNVIKLLMSNQAGAETARKVMHNLVGAIEIDSIRVLLDMSEDLLAGRNIEDVAKKEYPMIIEYSYWTQKENVPTDSPHWSVINMLNDVDKHFKFEYPKQPVTS